MRIGEHDASRAAREEHREQLGEVAGDVGERGIEHAHDLLVDRLDHARELAARVAHVVELLLQELVPLDQRFVLRERERVDRTHEPQLALELAPGPRASRRREPPGIGAAIAASGSQSNSRRTFSTACSSRSRISASSISSRPTRSRSSASFCSAAALLAQPVELAAGGPRGFGLLLAPAPQPVGEALGFRAAVDETRGERVDRVALLLELPRRARARPPRRGAPPAGPRPR